MSQRANPWEDSGSFLGHANHATNGDSFSKLLKEAISRADYVLPTTLGLVLMWPTLVDPEHWCFALIRPEGNFFVAAGGTSFATSLYGVQVSEQDAMALRRMLLQSLEELLRFSLLPRSPRHVLEQEIEAIRMLLDSSKGQRTLFSCRLS